jgi:hypothetical protein
MRLITPTSDQSGHRTFAVWEYDTGRPRRPASPDARKRYSVREFIGTFRTLEDARLTGAVEE